MSEDGGIYMTKQGQLTYRVVSEFLVGIRVQQPSTGQNITCYIEGLNKGTALDLLPPLLKTF